MAAVPKTRQTWAVYGLSVSAQSGGSLIAAPLASLIASVFGLPAMHLLSAALLIGIGTAYDALIRRQRVAAKNGSSRPATPTLGIDNGDKYAYNECYIRMAQRNLAGPPRGQHGSTQQRALFADPWTA